MIPAKGIFPWMGCLFNNKKVYKRSIVILFIFDSCLKRAAFFYDQNVLTSEGSKFKYRNSIEPETAIRPTIIIIQTFKKIGNRQSL